MEAKSNFPEDVLVEILSRLTVRHLLQLRCVSKLWCSVIEKCSFIQKHYKFQYQMLSEKGEIPLFCDKPSIYGLKEDPVAFHLLSKKLENTVLCLTPNLSRDSAPYFHDIDDPNVFNSFFCVGLADGVVILHFRNGIIGFWNPATREFKATPHPRPNQPDNVKESILSFIGGGYDPISHDFKVVRSINWMIRKDDWEKTFIYEMYSLRANSWKSFEFQWPNLSTNSCLSDGYFNNVHYWAPANDFENKGDDAPRLFGILAFNFTTEVFKLVNAPPRVTEDGAPWEWCLCKYKHFLAATFTGREYDDDKYDAASYFEIWVVTKFDDDDPMVPVTWEHLFTIGSLPEHHALWFTSFLNDGDMLLTIQGGEGASPNIIAGQECAIYNPTTRALKRLGRAFASCLLYVESLVSFSKIQG